MLRQMLDLLQKTGGVPLSLDTISVQLGVSHEVVDGLIRTLVQRGKLIEVSEGCTGCTSCPLKVVCSGAPTISSHGYALAEQHPRTIPLIE